MRYRLQLSTTLALAAFALAFLLAACASGTGGTGTPTPDPGTDVTVEVVDSQGRAVNGQGAVQIGDDAWEELAPTATGTYEFRVPDGESRYGFAVNCPSGLQASSTKVIAFQATIEEATELLATCPVSFTGPATTVEGSFDATAVGGDNVDIYTDVDSASSAGATPSGAYGPIATSAGTGRTLIGVANDASFDVVAVKILRNLNISSAATIDMNFNAGDAVGSVVSPDFSASVPGGYTPSLSTSLVADRSQMVSLGFASTAASSPLPTVSNMQADDLYLVVSQASNGASPATTVGTIQFQDTVSGLDLDLPQPWTTTPGIVGSALPTFTGLTELPNEPDFRGHLLIFTWEGIHDLPPAPGLGVGSVMQFFVSTGWRGSDTNFDVPNLTGVAGFSGARPLSGESAGWITGAVASSLDTATMLTSPALPLAFNTGILTPLYPPRVEGAVHRIGLIQDTFTVP